MSQRSVYVFFVMAALLQAGLAQAQRSRLGAGSPALPPNARFDEAPQLGEMVPDLTIVDDQGNPVNLRELATGQYTVLTLGCLT